MRVLVTGAAGNIGSVLCPGLAERGDQVTGLDLVAAPDRFPGTWAVADCTDPEAVHAAFAGADRDGGLDAVVHLAGIPTEAPLPDILDSHVRSTGVACPRSPSGSAASCPDRRPAGTCPPGSRTTTPCGWWTRA
jgi:uronate dehydrogenase